MSVRKDDYRTNRADYTIAATHRRAIADETVRDETMARKKKAMWLKERRSAKLGENPMESSPRPERTSRS